jgi:hypothetical protein
VRAEQGVSEAAPAGELSAPAYPNVRAEQGVSEEEGSAGGGRGPIPQ